MLVTYVLTGKASASTKTQSSKDCTLHLDGEIVAEGTVDITVTYAFKKEDVTAELIRALMVNAFKNGEYSITKE